MGARVLSILMLTASCVACASTPSTQSTSPADTIEVAPPVVLTLPRGREASAIAVSKRGDAVVATHPRGEYRTDEIRVFGGGGQRRIATTSFGKGEIDSVVVAGDWVGWVDKSRATPVEAVPVKWRVFVQQISGAGAPALLASSGGVKAPWAPYMAGGEGGFAWPTQGQGDRSEWVWTPQDGVRRIASTADIADPSVLSDRLVYVAKSPQGQDCWEQPIAGGAAKALTTSGLVHSCVAAGATVVYSEGIRPTDDDDEDAELDDPYRLWTLVEGRRTLIRRGFFEAGRLAIVSGRAVWSLGAKRFVSSSATDSVEVGRAGGLIATNGPWVLVAPLLLASSHDVVRLKLWKVSVVDGAG